MPVRLEWPASPVSELVTGYIVQESQDGGAFAQKAVVNQPVLEFNPAPGNYSWRVLAVNFVGVSAPSPVAVGPSVPSAPGQPTIVVVP